MPGDGAFQWVRRMGVHEAYHLDPGNRLIHWVCIPVELAAAAKLLTLARAGGVDASMPVIALLGILYVAAEPLAGALMVLLLAALRHAGTLLSTGSPWGDGALAVGVFVASFLVQTRIGHGVFERGVDDTRRNLEELRATWNPVPVLLVFFYHLVELLLAAGYRPALEAAMRGHRQAELERLRGPMPPPSRAAGAAVRAPEPGPAPPGA